MLLTKAWISTKLSASSSLTTLIGGTSHILDAWPLSVNIFPLLILTDENQIDVEYLDNKATGSEANIKIDIFSKADAGLPTTSAIGVLVASVFSDLLFHCGFNGEVPDPTEGVRHRVMRFSRKLLPSDLN